MIKALLIVAFIGHVICGYSDCLLSYGKKGRLDLKQIKDPQKMREMFEDVPLWQPMASILLGTLSITAFTFGYMALSCWMYKYNPTLAYVMLTASIFFAVPIVVHHVICGMVEWFYIRFNRTDEAREIVFDFQKKTIVTMVTGYAGLLVFLVCLLIAVVTKQTELPVWACVFNTLPLMILLIPTKFAAKGNIAGAIMFLGLTILI